MAGRNYQQIQDEIYDKDGQIVYSKFTLERLQELQNDALEDFKSFVAAAIESGKPSFEDVVKPMWLRIDQMRSIYNIGNSIRIVQGANDQEDIKIDALWDNVRKVYNLIWSNKELHDVIKITPDLKDDSKENQYILSDLESYSRPREKSSQQSSINVVNVDDLDSKVKNAVKKFRDKLRERTFITRDLEQFIEIPLESYDVSGLPQSLIKLYKVSSTQIKRGEPSSEPRFSKSERAELRELALISEEINNEILEIEDGLPERLNDTVDFQDLDSRNNQPEKFETDNKQNPHDQENFDQTRHFDENKGSFAFGRKEIPRSNTQKNTYLKVQNLSDFLNENRLDEPEETIKGFGETYRGFSSGYDSVSYDDQEGVLKIPRKDYAAVITKLESAEARSHVYHSFNAATQEIDSELEELAINVINLRNKRARALGYKNYFEEANKCEKIYGGPEKIIKALDEGLESLREISKKELEAIDRIAKESGHEKLRPEDCYWANTKYMSTRHDTTYRDFHHFMDVKTSLKSSLEVMSSIHGKIEEIDNGKGVNESVKVYKVTSNKEGKPHSYMQIMPYAAEGSTKTCCNFMSGANKNGIINGSMKFQFSKEKGLKDRVSYGQHETVNHEIGHWVYGSQGNYKTLSTSGVQCHSDVVEVPSVVYENLAFIPSVMKKHMVDQRTGKKITDKQVKDIRDSTLFFEGQFTLQSLARAKIEIELYTSEEDITVSDYHKIKETVLKKNGVAPHYADVLNPIVKSMHHIESGTTGKFYTYKTGTAVKSSMAQKMLKPDGEINMEGAQSFNEKFIQPGATVDTVNALKNAVGNITMGAIGQHISSFSPLNNIENQMQDNKPQVTIQKENTHQAEPELRGKNKNKNVRRKNNFG